MEIEELYELESEQFLDIVSKNIERIRENKGMTKLDVSRQLGFMAPDHYSRMELRANQKHFNLKHIYKLSKIFDIEVCELVSNNTN